MAVDPTVIARLQRWFLDATSALRASIARRLQTAEGQIAATSLVVDDLMRQCEDLRARTAAGSRWSGLVERTRRGLREEEQRLAAETQTVAADFSSFAQQVDRSTRQVVDDSAAAVSVIARATNANSRVATTQLAVAGVANEIAATASDARQAAQRWAA
ncbi:MAG TPA: hypothetical protein PLV92_26800, partial [Pirellulaceae bacterium]|nr:hypothetical protein [Pirellulaceae bacterium]